MPPPIDPEKQFLAAYQEAGQSVRHHSTLRATLVVLFTTLGGGTLLKYMENTKNDLLFWVGAFTLSISFLVNSYFFLQTVKYTLFQKSIWKWFNDTQAPRPILQSKRNWKDNFNSVRKDALNLLYLILIIAFILIARLTGVESLPAPNTPHHDAPAVDKD